MTDVTEVVPANPEPGAVEARAAIEAHIWRVRELMYELIHKVEQRAHEHDLTKLEPGEIEAWEQLGINTHNIKYGTSEYFAQFDLTPGIKEAVRLHYARYPHHPEHHLLQGNPDLTLRELKYLNLQGLGIEQMTLVDLIEMIPDWKAASERYKDSSIADSMEHNKERFGINDQLAQIIENTIRMMGW